MSWGTTPLLQIFSGKSDLQLGESGRVCRPGFLIDAGLGQLRVRLIGGFLFLEQIHGVVQAELVRPVWERVR